MEESIDAFIRFLAVERGFSENYQLSTQRSLSDFAHWCGASKNIDNPRAVTLPVISEYLGDRKRAGLSASSIKLIMVALKIFFRFLAGKGTIDRDPAEALALPRIERYLPETLNELQVEQFLENIDTKAVHGLRDRAMIELLYASGLRISELANARLENFNFEERILRVTGKGNKTRLVPVGRKACEALAAYLSVERPKVVKPRSGSEIFLSERGSKLTTARIWQIVKKHAQDLRKTFTLIFSGIVSRRICSGTAPICGSSRRCWATRIFRRRRFIRMSINSGLKLCIGNFIPGRNSRRHSDYRCTSLRLNPYLASSIQHRHL